jgi:methionyl-tRNA formyltransferase
MLIKKKVAFLFDKKNIWLLKYLSSFKKLSKKYTYSITKHQNKIKNFDIVFILGYTKILSENFIARNKIVLVIHESDLPKNKGFAPVQWQILQKKKIIPVSLILLEKNASVDSGGVILKNKILLKGHELYEDIRDSQFNASFKLIKKFLDIYPNFKVKKQKGKSTFFRRRNPEDSQLNINRSIKSQFNLLRICNNNDWPAFFLYKRKKYILKISKSDEIK